jgi:signal transduction histidine kinase
MDWLIYTDHNLESASLSAQASASNQTLKPGWIGITVVYLVFASLLARTLAAEETRPFLASYLTLELVFLGLYTLMLWKSGQPVWLQHLYLLFQSSLVLWMLSIQPQFDFIILLFVLLTYQVCLYFSGWLRWTWVGLLIFLSGGPLIYYLGLLQGLARSLTTITGEIVLPGYLIAGHEMALSRQKSQELLSQLQGTHQQLKLYTEQAEELAAMQERNRLARELHDTVSQLIFSISLTTRSAQLLIEKEPARLPELLSRLQELNSQALSQLRSFITQLHPPSES